HRIAENSCHVSISSSRAGPAESAARNVPAIAFNQFQERLTTDCHYVILSPSARNRKGLNMTLPTRSELEERAFGTSPIPRMVRTPFGAQLLVVGRPFLSLGGELHNSSPS